ncbi:hypothetical protein AABB24_014270 [Solanum stoloniferum]|uniref:Uncharacterized protein n=1 Tax=Solanum stoloniferum TaxID=62892 RepID=A0ABD2U032_9SOLN
MHESWVNPSSFSCILLGHGGFLYRVNSRCSGVKRKLNNKSRKQENGLIQPQYTTKLGPKAHIKISALHFCNYWAKTHLFWLYWLDIRIGTKGKNWAKNPMDEISILC